MARSAALELPQVVKRGAEDYEVWRQSMPWQMRKPARYPAAIMRPTTVAEVGDAVRFARREGLQVTTRSGGHHVWGAMLRDDGLLVDMSRFRGVTVNPADGTATVGPAAWSDRLARELAAENLAFPVAHCATVPMGGYLMGGGLGINGDEWGPLACFSVIGADIVTADGERVTANADENQDLYWAVRGAGHGFFGIVTAYKLKLYPLPKAIRVNAYIYPVARLAELGDWLRGAAADLPKTELLVLLLENPDADPAAPPAERKLCVVRPAVFADSDEEAERILRPLAEHPLAKEALFSTGLQATTMQRLLEESIDYQRGFGFGRYAVDTLWADPPQPALDVVAQEFLQAPARKSHVVVTIKRNAALPDDAALSQITDTWIGAYAVWDRAADDRANIDWLRQTSAALQPFAAGHSINELDTGADPGKIERTFSPEAWRRLGAVRAARDPDGIFHGFLESA
ncbi:MAG: FAD-binding oxidoreductase [Chromatiales bacterium]|nr:MAG: FAD-binding oxidoreductase [Chromatiales bacterium]